MTSSKHLLFWLLFLVLFFLPTHTKAGEDSRDPSYAATSAIKSIAGKKPDTEFFDLYFKFNYSGRVFMMSNVDVALSDVNTDTVSSAQERLSDAGIALNVKAYSNDDSSRSLFFSPLPFLKIFNGEMFLGLVNIGSIEQKQSAFYSSYVRIAYLRRFFKDSNHKATSNLYVEFVLRSEEHAFFKSLVK